MMAQVLSALFTFASFAVLLSVVVFVHELGHLLAAKRVNVKAEKFSIGFGPKLFGFHWGETEYRLSALPLGGYVKFAGDDPTVEVAPADRGRGFLEATPGARAFIAFAGPLGNFVLAFAVAFILNLLPHPDLAPQVGFVKRGSPADKGGLRHGDRVLSVDGQPIRSFFELQEKVTAIWDRPIALHVERKGRPLDLSVTPSAFDDANPLETVRRGRIGIAASPRRAVVALLSPQGAAGRAGLRTFDTIEKLDGAKVADYEELIQTLAERLSAPAGPATRLELSGLRGRLPAGEPAQTRRAHDEQQAARPPPEPFTGLLELPAPLGREVGLAEAEELLGLACADLNIAVVQPGGPAEKAGLLRGDRLVAVAGRPVTWWADDIERARLSARDAPLQLTVLRDGARLELTARQTLRSERDDAGVRVEVPELGAEPDWAIQWGDRAMITLQYGPLEAGRRAVTDVVERTRQIGLGLYKILTGKLSSEAVGGPLMIADVSRKAADVGFGAFFLVLSLISLNLGLMNLIPLPILDGFHILSAAIEAIRRRPLSLQFREAASRVGLALVLGLMLLALRNDLVRKFLD
jgi:regulator of sigma E protease